MGEIRRHFRANRSRRSSLAGGVAIVLAGLAAGPVGLHAQTSDYREFQLQPQATATPRASGPVAPDGEAPRAIETDGTSPAPIPVPLPTISPKAAPVVAPVASGPSEAGKPAPAATQAPENKAEPAARAGPQPTPRQGLASPRPAVGPAVEPSTNSAATTAAELPATADVASGAAPIEPPGASTVPVTTGSAPSSDLASPSPALAPFGINPLAAGALALALVLFAASAISYRRRSVRAEAAASEFARQTAAATPPAPTDDDAASPSRDSQSQPETSEAPASPPAAPIVVTAPRRTETPGIDLEARRLSATLINATLTYRLALTNTGIKPLEDIAIGGDMIAAHATLPIEQQLGTDGAAFSHLHRIASLAPGESVLLGGDLSLPLSAIRAIQHGDQRLFVPLARFETSWHAATSRKARISAFLVGLLPDGASDRLRPFRLDLGPRIYSDIGQRLLGAIS